MRYLLVVVSLALSTVSGVAIAADPILKDRQPNDNAVRPWAVGVAQTDQDAAIELFAEGTRLLKDAFFTRAVDRYRQALARWDHPAIHFNLAKALMNLDNPAEAYQHLDASLKYGGAPLDAEQIEQAKHYKKDLYDNELAELVVSATEPDTIVTLNNTILFTAPGSWTGVVRPKDVSLIASKTGFATVQLTPKLDLGKKNEIAIEMLPVDRNVQYARAFPNWIPWTVFSTGVLLLGGGAVSTWQASESYKAYDSGVLACNSASATTVENGIGEVHACFPSKAVTDKKAQGDLFSTLSTVGYIAGGAVVSTGIILLIVNREKPITTEGTVAPLLTVLPYVGPEGAGVSATVGF